MKKFITSLLSLALVIGMCPAMIANADVTLSGTGVEGDPYIIATADDLKAARDMINADTDGTGAAAACYEVTADITLPEGDLWTPITPYSPYFTGTFDGNEHVIYNVNIELNNDNYVNYSKKPYLAFFGGINDGAVVKDLGLDGVKVTNNATFSTSNNTWQRIPGALAGFVGYFRADAEVSNCFVKHATIAQNGGTTSYAPIGGFCGKGGDTANPKFTNCYVYDAKISSTCKNANYRDYLAGFGADPNYAKTTYTNCYTAQTFITKATSENEPFYAFAKKGLGGGANSTATGCYAEADDITTMPGLASYNYDATKSLGTIGATKDAIVEAMTAVGYVTDATVNDGYPCFAWEVPEVEPWNGEAATSFEKGTGKENDPYQITTAAELKLASDMTNDTSINGQWSGNFYFKLMNDIDYENNAWIPLGKSNQEGSYAFRGGFDGNNHVVKNLKINYDCSASGLGDVAIPRYMGFFGYVQKGEIKNLGIDNIQITISNPDTSANRAQNIGGFAGRLSGSNVSNCYVKNSSVKQTSGSTETSGVAGFVHTLDSSNGIASSVTNCYVYDVDLYCGYARAQVGFVAVAKNNSSISNCYANATNTRTSSTTHPVYGFGYTGSASTAYTEGTTATTSNCYSTLADTNVSATSTFGTTGQSVATIAGVFENLEGWQDGENINEGLPALAWEKAPVVEVVAPYVVKQVSTAKDTVTLTVNNATEGDQIYIATYDSEGRLIAVDIQNVATTITTAVSADNAATVKVFIWNGVTPVIDAVVKDLY